MASDTWRATLREFFVDILGSLVPGFLFVFLAGVSLGWPMLALCQVVVCLGSNGAFPTQECIDFFRTAHTELVLFVVALSYALGHFFYRQAPKAPDERSVRSKEVATDLKKGDGAVRFPASGKAPDVQFPYRYLYELLTIRGLAHLANIVPWKGEDPTTHTRRSKAFINILKTRLAFACPDKCGTITRNEAHIRLMSSVWYMCRSLAWFAVAGFIISVSGSLLLWATAGTLGLTRLFPLCLLSGSVFIGVSIARRIIERFFHYQRVREVIFVLETAFFASKTHPDILKELN